MAKHIPESSFFDMLRNIFYAGKICVPPTKNEPAQIVEGRHEPLIDEETFFMVQEVLDGKKKKSPKVNKEENALLKKRIRELEKALSFSRLETEARDILIDKAEEYFNVPIRKKSGAKQ